MSFGLLYNCRIDRKLEVYMAGPPKGLALPDHWVLPFSCKSQGGLARFALLSQSPQTSFC